MKYDFSNRVIVEIANVHEGDNSYFHKICQQVKDSGFNKIKFQYVIPEELCEKNSEQFIEFERLKISHNQFKELLLTIENLDVYFDVFGPDSLAKVNDLKKSFPHIIGIKYHSTESLNRELILSSVNKFEEIILAIGGLSAIELNSLIISLEKNDILNKFIFAYGVQSYPSLPNQTRINKLLELKNIYNIKICLSDHIDGDNYLSKDIVKYALMLGYDYVEKHITIDRSRRLDDDHAALEISEFIQIKNELEEIETLFCDDVLSLNKDELKYRKIVKKSIFAKKDIPKGLLIDEKNIISRRLLPKEEIDFIDRGDLIGREVVTNIKKGQKVLRSHLKNNIYGIIIVRSKSNRLPGKSYKNILGIESIRLLIERIKKTKLITKIILCTTTGKEDDRIEQIALESNINVYRGQENVSERLNGLFETFGNPDFFVRLTGDNILVDPLQLDEVVVKLLEKNYDYYKHNNVIEGFDFELIKYDAYKTLKVYYSNFAENSEYLTLFLNNDYFQTMKPITYESNINYLDYRLTLDYQEDLFNIRSLTKKIANYYFSYSDICDVLINNPELYKKFNPKVKGSEIIIEKNTLFQ